MNDHNDKSGEDSEYHFSGDDEVNYEVEQDTSPSATPAGPETRSVNVPRRDGGGKRMFVSLAVFIVLVVVVYKIVAPGSSSAPATQITVPAVAQNATPQAAAPAVSAPASVVAQRTMTPAVQPVSRVANLPAMPAPVAVVANAQSSNTSPAAMPVTQRVTPPVPQQPMPVVATIPTVIPVQSPTSNMNPMANVAENPNSQVQQQVVTQETSFNTDVARKVSQLHSQYTQVITELSAQNKSLQGQIEELHSRVAGLETELHQLTGELLRQQGGAANIAPGKMNNSNPIAPELRAIDPRVSFNVQAIIPGRAWLRSDSGETVTVAEGDVIKDFGRITKIDPYDGIVEINTGNKVVSLSYGNGG